MNRKSNKNKTKEGQEVPRINLNMKIDASQHLVQQGQDKEGAGGKGNKNKPKGLKMAYKIDK